MGNLIGLVMIAFGFNFVAPVFAHHDTVSENATCESWYSKGEYSGGNEDRLVHVNVIVDGQVINKWYLFDDHDYLGIKHLGHKDHFTFWDKSGTGSVTTSGSVTMYSKDHGFYTHVEDTDTLGLNFNKESCQEPTATPTPSPVCDDGQCVTPTPTEEVTPTPTQTPCTENCGNPPTFAGSSTEAPVCSDGTTTQLPANVHVLRNGSDATVNFFITEGDSANIYWRVVGSSEWQNAASDVKPNSDKFVSYTVHDLDANLGYDFGVQQKHGCGGGQLVTAVVVDGPVSTLFPFTYWEWSK